MGTGGGENVDDTTAASKSSNNNPVIIAGRRRFRIIVNILMVVAALSCLLLLKSAYPFEFLPLRISSFASVSVPAGQTSSDLFDADLETVLRKASMDDKTIIITSLNQAWAEPQSIIDVFLESFKVGNQTNRLLKHLVIVSMDQKAHNRCLAIHPHCYALNTQGVNFSSEAYFMTSDYLKMMWRRIEFLGSVLQMGFNFVFTDADIMWLQDPFPHFHKDADFQIACDYYIGNSYDKNNQPNGGFTYVRSNPRTILFYKFWYASRQAYPGKHDQDVLNNIKYHPFLYKIGLRMRFLDTTYFGGFCSPSKDFNLVCTMHANCCFGLANKLHDLKLVLEDWENFMALPASIKASPSPISWRVPQNCSVAEYHPPVLPNKNQQGTSS